MVTVPQKGASLKQPSNNDSRIAATTTSKAHINLVKKFTSDTYKIPTTQKSSFKPLKSNLKSPSKTAEKAWDQSQKSNLSPGKKHIPMPKLNNNTIGGGLYSNSK